MHEDDAQKEEEVDANMDRRTTQEKMDELSIFKNIETVVNMLNEAEDKKKNNDGQNGNKEANEEVDLERDDDSMEFAFEDAID